VAISWAHPKFGSILASCSYDKKVIIWKENSSNNWSKLFEFDKHQSSVNSISWAPHEFGLTLACGSSDTKISILQHKDNNWTTEMFTAHEIGVNSVSWAPAYSPGSATQKNGPTQLSKRLVSGGCDNAVKIWNWSENDKEWKKEAELSDGHKDWVRDVAWAPSIGLPSSCIASCSQDGEVIIWTKDSNSNQWKGKTMNKFSDVVWRVSWSIVGNILAVSSGDNKITLWKESLQEPGTWKTISSLDDVPDST